MLPVRCFTCNKILGRYDQIYEKYKSEDRIQDFFNDFHIIRYCCRKIFLTHIDIYQINSDIKFPHDNIICKKENEIIKIIKAI